MALSNSDKVLRLVKEMGVLRPLASFDQAVVLGHCGAVSLFQK